MSFQYSVPNPPVPLPQVPGPKLAHFTPDAHAEIKFIENLGNPDDLDSQVWKAEINGTVYSLKMAYVDYYDPFNCECRAYGDRPWGRWEEHRGQPIRAIVKELAEDDDLDEAFNTGRISTSTMWRDLEDLHALGILVRDIYLDNYIGGRLVDFSRAWTG
ncbi:hypothetical protein J7T55_009968 [Diaporthe amygdali]|uniref:uncharacterized protein n=1 Tax=Phomopsis amygdali TaxID=1214568 RepID=UPI0022FF286B|nr:uncharacterized protein J7T55_009968 [Diaporthe amygdali]KAJ0116817.1 hypothetical protein J7T55_009968 [Diaporthe amygdali]